MADLPETFVPGFHDENAVRKMKYTKFGDTGMSISWLSLGAGGFCSLYGEFSLEECKAVVHEALKNGINYIDTAPYYGQGTSEEILGKCLEGIPRKAYYIATKVGRYEMDPKLMFDYSAKKTRESIETSLKKLRLDYVDVLQVHDMQFANSKVLYEETLPVLKEAQNQGKTRFVGITDYSVSQVANCVEKSPIKIDSVLVFARLSMLNQGLKEYIPFFKSKKVGVVNAACHCMGLLSSTGPPYWHPSTPEIQTVCAEARDYCKKQNVEIANLALDYALHQEGPNTVLVGVNRPHLLRANLDVYYNGLSEKEKQVSAHVQNKILSKLSVTEWDEAKLLKERMK